MTIKPILKLASAVVLMGALGTANAATISIVGGGSAAVGDTVALDVFVDFDGTSTIGGGFDVVFDSSALQFDGFDATFPGDPAFSRSPDVLDGLLSGFAFGDFNGVIDFVGSVGTLNFTVLSAGSEVIGADTGSITGPFLDLATFQPIPVDYVGTTVGSAVIPVPAAVWLMFGGLGALFGFGRKRA